MSPAAVRLEQALELAELAEEMLRMKLRRTLPDATDAAIDRLIDDWYLSRPGAPDGDAHGRVFELPRRRR